MISREQLEQMIVRLDAMTPKFHAPADGLGKFLGDGLPHPGTKLRTVVLASALKELLSLREALEEISSSGMSTRGFQMIASNALAP